MVEDRRRYDPWAPAPRESDTAPPAAPTPAAPPAAEPAVAEAASPAADLESMRKAALIQLAADRHLDSGGTKAELVERLRAAGA